MPLSQQSQSHLSLSLLTITRAGRRVKLSMRYRCVIAASIARAVRRVKLSMRYRCVIAAMSLRQRGSIAAMAGSDC